MEIAQAIARGSTHPSAPGGCVIVRGREIIGCLLYTSDAADE